MDKALRILIILLLVLSIGALVLEILVFGQREELKGRNLVLARGVKSLAEYIEVPPATNADLVARADARVKLTDDELKRFFKLDAAGKPEKDAAGKKITSGAGTLDGTLVDLVGKASLQVNRLNDTRTGLEQTRTELGQTKDTLRETENNLTAAKQDIKEKAETIATQKTDIEQKTEKIGGLTADKEKLESKVETQGSEITKLTDKLNDTENNLQQTKKFVERLQRDLVLAKGATEGGTNVVPSGLHGQILTVNTNWNFVVIDILPDSELMPMIDLNIQRDSKLIGKVRISEVVRERSLAVGEVLEDWQQMPVAKGDYVFY
jgi:hypothetical protein